MNPRRGGVQRVSDTLARYFSRCGHELYYLTFEYDKEDSFQFPAKIRHLPDASFFSVVNLKYYQNLLAEEEIDIIVNHDSSNDRSKFFLNTGKHRVKKISLYHTDPLYGLHNIPDLSKVLRNQAISDFVARKFSGTLRRIKGVRKKREIRFLLKHSDSLVLLSEQFKNKIQDELNIDSSRIVAINNPNFLLNVPETTKGKKILLFVARLELSVKRPDLMLHIWSNLYEKHPDWELCFLGDGPDRDHVEGLAKSLNLKNVRFEGYRNPVPYFQEASVICMTSEYEGFGLALIEAMQFGLVPIVFNNWISLRDIIIDEVTGILVERGNIISYTIKLDQLLSDDSLRKRISIAAKDHVKRFHIDTIGPQWIKLFQDLVVDE